MRPSVEAVIATVARHFDMRPSLIKSGHRRAPVVAARWLAMYLIRELCTERSLPAIARAFGGLDHTTVLHALRAMAVRIELDKALRRTVETLRDRILRRVEPGPELQECPHCHRMYVGPPVAALAENVNALGGHNG